MVGRSYARTLRDPKLKGLYKPIIGLGRSYTGTLQDPKLSALNPGLQGFRV